jgi:hypothetical protein
MSASSDHAYKYRVAFGAWINDMRLTPLPLEDWPAPVLDDDTVAGITRALDVQSAAGFTHLDVWGLFATFGWPTDLTSAVDDGRRKRIHRILQAARDRGMTLSYGMGVYSWGYDKILDADPAVRGKLADGSPHPHAMCDANPKSFEYVTRILDFVLGEFDFGAVHLESCDLGCCQCPECAGGKGMVDYNCRLNEKTADYIKSRWPEKTVYVITISWIPIFTTFSQAELDRVVQLGDHIDCLFDQGHTGYQVAPEDRAGFLSRLKCAYGTSGGRWLYPDARWDRGSYFVPFPRYAAETIRREFDEGIRASMFYQGPMSNPGVEVNVSVAGRVLADTRRHADDALAEVLEVLYKPVNQDARARLLSIFERGEEAFFGQWDNERFVKDWGRPMPGEFHLSQLFGTEPGAAHYLLDPFLDAAGRKACKAELISILEDIPKLAGQCEDDGRLEKIERGAIMTINLINTISVLKGES